MSTRMPPAPPANRTPHGGDAKTDDAEEAKVADPDANDRNLKQRGHQGKIAQNIRNQGFRLTP
ncbi:MAG: hypothetical protein K1X51_16245 [Rhodospirillaceae bacterium]|nr:hypothetical protein [Rhodospirillaceae bacterium]